MLILVLKLALGSCTFLPALVGGAIGLMGGLMQNTSSAKQAQKQTNFQMDMSNTAHQREVADLRAAGLNPILSGTGGSGAPGAAGASAPMTDPLGRGLSSAQDARRSDQENKSMRLQTDILNAEKHIREDERAITANELWESNLRNQGHRIAADRGLAYEHASRVLQDEKTARAVAESTAKDAELELEVNKLYGITDRAVRRGAGTIGAVLESARPLGRVGTAASSARAAGVQSRALREPQMPPAAAKPKPRGGRSPDIVDPATGEILRRR